MAYRRRRRIIYRKRGPARRRRYAISRYNTFRYRSAKAQANQIYRINRKVNTIEKRTKPEIKIYQNAYNFTMSNWCGETFGGFTTGMHNSIKGRIARIQDISGWFNLWKTGNADNLAFEATVRIVVYQIRQSMSGADLPFHARDLMNITAAEEELEDQVARKRAYMRAIFGPLRHGITSKVRVLRDFRINVVPNRLRSTKRFKIRNSFVLAKSQQNGEPYPQNGVFFVALYTVNKASETFDDIYLQQVVKVAYIDED